MALALVNREGNDETLAVGIIRCLCRNDAHVGIAMAEIEASQLSPVHLDAVGVIEIIAQEKAQKVRFTRLDHLLEPLRGIGPVADDHDLLDPGPHALLDLEYEIDALVRQLDDLGLNAHVETATAMINVGHADNVSLHGRPRHRAPLVSIAARLAAGRP